MTPSAEMVAEAVFQLSALGLRMERTADLMASVGRDDAADKLRADAAVAREWIREIEWARP